MEKLIRTASATVLASLVVFLSFITTAWAADTLAAEELLELGKVVWAAFAGGQHAYGAAMAVVLLVTMARKYGSKWWPWLGSAQGGAALVLLSSFAGTLAAGLAAGAALSTGMAWTALGIAVAAAGGYSMVKALLVDPWLLPLVDKAPAWLRPFLKMALWAFSKPNALATAKVAGDKAVAAKPAAGFDIGEPHDLP